MIDSFLLNLASVSDAGKFLGMDWMNEDFYKLSFRFSVNIIFLTLLIRYIYYAKTPRKNYLFTFYLISIITFVICFALKKLNIDTGMGLGLFAIFGIIRYRTNPMRIREMTYLFIAIGISVVNAIGKQISYAELFFINGIVLAFVFILENWWLINTEVSKTIIYEKIENIKPANSAILKADLEDRTGLTIDRVQVGKVDFLKDVAEVKIYFKHENQEDINDIED